MCDTFCDKRRTFCDTFTVLELTRGSVTIFERLSDSQAVVTMTKAKVFWMAIMMAVQFQIRGPLPFDALNDAAAKDVWMDSSTFAEALVPPVQVMVVCAAFSWCFNTPIFSAFYTIFSCKIIYLKPQVLIVCWFVEPTATRPSAGIITTLTDR